MRILDEDGDKVIDRVTLYLLMTEAREFRDSLNALISNPIERHEHISSADFNREITVCIYDPAHLESFDDRSKKILSDDSL
jgi:hypothetical protein